MNAFRDCQQVKPNPGGSSSVDERRPARPLCDDGQRPLAAELQKKYGDLFLNRPNGDLCAVEIKAEREEKFGNFLEKVVR